MWQLEYVRSRGAKRTPPTDTKLNDICKTVYELARVTDARTFENVTKQQPELETFMLRVPAEQWAACRIPYCTYGRMFADESQEFNRTVAGEHLALPLFDLLQRMVTNARNMYVFVSMWMDPMCSLCACRCPGCVCMRRCLGCVHASVSGMVALPRSRV